MDARRILLDALEALGAHRDAVILVGAQAVYLHTGEGDMAVAPFTTDADLALDPRSLGPDPRIEEAMTGASFERDRRQPGIWWRDGVEVDLLVPARLGGPGSRGARLGVHGNRAARKVSGLEAVLVDNGRMRIKALAGTDSRVHDVAVAGPAALLVAKLHKVAERVAERDRTRAKDALDIYRLLRLPTADLAQGFERALDTEIARDAAAASLEELRRLFADRSGAGLRLLEEAVAGLEDEAFVTESCVALAGDLLDVTRSS